jgi:hypothetical protein
VSVLTQSDDKYVALGARDRGGDKYVGWIWRVLDGRGAVVGVVSSDPGYDHYATERR